MVAKTVAPRVAIASASEDCAGRSVAFWGIGEAEVDSGIVKIGRVK